MWVTNTVYLVAAGAGNIQGEFVRNLVRNNCRYKGAQTLGTSFAVVSCFCSKEEPKQREGGEGRI
jgi:hypothetical protein